MKTWVWPLAALCLGTGVGLGTTIVERASHDEPFLPAEFRALSNAKKEEQAETLSRIKKRPKVEFVNDRVYDFGSMERLSKQRHTFLIKNTGDGPLEMDVLRTTCKCTISAVNGESFMPGETGKITVEWTGKTQSPDPEFRQGVEIGTNDPDHEQISLIISGYVTDSIRAYPPVISIGRVSSKTGGQAEFRLFGFRTKKLDILGTDFEDLETSDLFDVEYEPLPPKEVEKEKGASCGLLGRVSVKSGLPLGPIIQTIRIQAHVEKEVTIYMPVKGITVSDIVLASSKKFEAGRNLLNFGPLTHGESATATVQIFVRGDHRRETTFSVGEVDPAEYIKVDIGPPEELNDGKTVRYKVTFAIRGGLDRINRLGAEYGEYGRVVLETTDPTTKQVPIRVRFAVD